MTSNLDRLQPISPHEYTPLATKIGLDDQVNPLSDAGNGFSTRLRPEKPQDPSIIWQKPSVWARLKETWTVELLGFVIAAAARGAIIALLRMFEGQREPRWPITLNFLISLLGTLASACTLYGAHHSISQLKWIWFTRRARPLVDLQPFQLANHTTGAVQLFLKLGAWDFFAFGMVTIILGSLWDPFTQNLIHYYDGNVVDSNQISRLARSLEYTGEGPPKDNTYNYIDPLLLLNMQTALVSAPAADVNQPTFFCSTGNCTWDPIATLASVPCALTLRQVWPSTFLMGTVILRVCRTEAPLSPTPL